MLMSAQMIHYRADTRLAVPLISTWIGWRSLCIRFIRLLSGDVVGPTVG